MTNLDVIKMVQAGLGESVVFATIRTAKRTAFELDPDNLIGLKKAGVTDGIVSLMLDPTAPPLPPRLPAGSPVLPTVLDTRARTTDSAAPVEVPREPGIYVDLGVGTPNLVALEPTTFSQGKSGGFFTSALTYGIVKAKWKAVVRSKNAGFRVSRGVPVFYFYFEQQPSGLGSTSGFSGWLSGATSPNEFVLAKMEKKAKERELVVGEFAWYGSSSGTRSKDTVAFNAERLSSGIYRVTPSEPLPQGEYSFFYAAGVSTFTPGMLGKLFDFGVDLQLRD